MASRTWPWPGASRTPSSRLSEPPGDGAAGQRDQYQWLPRFMRGFTTLLNTEPKV